MKTCDRCQHVNPHARCVCEKCLGALPPETEPKRPSANSAIEPLGSPCSLYRGYTLRVEVKVAGAWHADSNWGERELQKALARAQERKTEWTPRVEDARVIRMRFEVVGHSAEPTHQRNAPRSLADNVLDQQNEPQ